MPLLLLIDGYNLSQPVAPLRRPEPNWLQRNRMVLLRDLAEFLPDSVRKQTCVVFDAANPPKNRPSVYRHEEIEVRFAVGYPTADDLLEELIQANHTPKRLTVVSSDHRIQNAARRRNAAHFDGEPWLDDLTDGKIRLAIPLPGNSKHGGGESGEFSGRGRAGRHSSPKGGPDASGESQSPLKPRIEDPQEVDDWMRKFGFDTE